MTSPHEDTEDAIDLAGFHEWLEQTAEHEAVSNEEVLGRLVNTYWILSELTELADESTVSNLMDTTEQSDAAPTDDDAPDDARSRSELVEVIRSIAEMHQGATPEQESPREIDESVLELVKALNQGDQTASASPSQGWLSYTDVRTMVDDIRSVEGDIERLDETVTEGFTELRTTVHQHEAALEELTADTSDHGDRLDRIESRFDASYADIRKILTHLIEASNEQDASIDAIVEAYEEEIGRLRDETAALESLVELRTDAARRDISRAACEGCDQSFEVSLLARPNCPHCDRPIVEFDSRRDWLSRTTFVALTTPRQAPSTADAPADLTDRIERTANRRSSGTSKRLDPDDLDLGE